MSDDVEKIILIILCIFLPPLAVYMKTKDCDINVLIALILMIFFWLPGILYAFWFCFMRG